MALRLATPLLASLPQPSPGFPSRGAASLAFSRRLQCSEPGTKRKDLSLRLRPRAETEGQDSRRTSGDAEASEQEALRGDAAGSPAQRAAGGASASEDSTKSNLPAEASPAKSYAPDSDSSGIHSPGNSSSAGTTPQASSTEGHSQKTGTSTEQDPERGSREPSAAKPSEDDIEEQLDGILQALEAMSSGEAWGKGSMYSAMASLVRVEGRMKWPLLDEDGMPVGTGFLQGEQLAEALQRMADTPGVEASTAQAVRSSLLGPENAVSPFVARTAGEVGEYVDCEVDAGTLFFGELREGSDAATASQWLSAAVRRSFPGLRVALLPFPDTAEDVAEQYKLDPSRRCALLLFKQFSFLQLPLLRWFLGPALLLALLQLKEVTVQDAALSAGFESATATAIFVIAAVLPTTSALCGQLAWAAAYNRVPQPLDCLPVLSPGSGISVVFSNVQGILQSRKQAVDFALASTLGSLGASLVLLQSSSCSALQPLPLPVPSLDEFGLPESVAQAASQIPGTVLVPQSILQHSVPLNQMADRLACASLPDPNSDLTVLLALPPLALAGLLGLHLTALGLIPFSKSPGARLVEATVDDLGLVALSQILAFTFLAVCFFTTGAPVFPIFFFASIFATVGATGEQIVALRWDGISPAGALRSLLSAVLVGGGLLLLLPKPLYGWLLAAGLGPYAESFYDLFLPTR